MSYLLKFKTGVNLGVIADGKNDFFEAGSSRSVFSDIRLGLEKRSRGFDEERDILRT